MSDLSTPVKCERCTRPHADLRPVLFRPHGRAGQPRPCALCPYCRKELEIDHKRRQRGGKSAV